MIMLVSLRHGTRYLYDRPVTLGPHEIRLKPVPGCRTPVPSYSLSVRPAQHSIHWHHDAAGNNVARVLFQEKIPQFEIDVALTADLAPVNPFDFLVSPGAERFPLAYPDTVRPELQAYLSATENGVQLQRWLMEFRASEKPEGRGTIDLLAAINGRVKRDIAYVTRMEHGIQSCEDTLGQRSGSCRDSGWFLVQALRHLGIAARFVSGYLIQLSGSAPDAPKVTGSVEPSNSLMQFSMSVHRL